MSEKPPSGDNREWIKYRLRCNGYTLQQVGDMAGVTRAAVSLALKKGTPSPRISKVISLAIGVPADQLWQSKQDIK